MAAPRTGLGSCPYDILDIIFKYAEIPRHELKELRLICHALRSAVDPVLFRSITISLHNPEHLNLINQIHSSDEPGITYPNQKKGHSKAVLRYTVWRYVRQYVRVLHIRHETNVPDRDWNWNINETKRLTWDIDGFDNFIFAFECLSEVHLYFKAIELLPRVHGKLIETTCAASSGLLVKLDLEVADQVVASLPFHKFKPESLIFKQSLKNLSSLSLTRSWQFTPRGGNWTRDPTTPEQWLLSFVGILSNSPNLKTLRIDYNACHGPYIGYQPYMRYQKGYGGRIHTHNYPLDLDYLFGLVGYSKLLPKLQHLKIRSAFLPLKEEYLDRWFSSLTTLKYEPYHHTQTYFDERSDITRTNEGWRALTCQGYLKLPTKLRVELSRGSIQYFRYNPELSQTLSSLTIVHNNGSYREDQRFELMLTLWNTIIPSFRKLQVLKLKHPSCSDCRWKPNNITRYGIGGCQDLRYLQICPAWAWESHLPYLVFPLLKDLKKLEVLCITARVRGRSKFSPARLQTSSGKRLCTKAESRERNLRERFIVRFKDTAKEAKEQDVDLVLSSELQGDYEESSIWSFKNKALENQCQGNGNTCAPAKNNILASDRASQPPKGFKQGASYCNRCCKYISKPIIHLCDCLSGGIEKVRDIFRK